MDDIVNGANTPNTRKSSNQFDNKNMKCFYCDKLFYNERGLRQHCMQSHYKALGYSYKCDQCTHKFKTKDVLEHHMNDMHD